MKYSPRKVYPLLVHASEHELFNDTKLPGQKKLQLPLSEQADNKDMFSM